MPWRKMPTLRKLGVFGSQPLVQEPLPLYWIFKATNHLSGSASSLVNPALLCGRRQSLLQGTGGTLEVIQSNPLLSGPPLGDSPVQLSARLGLQVGPELLRFGHQGQVEALRVGAAGDAALAVGASSRVGQRELRGQRAGRVQGASSAPVAPFGLQTQAPAPSPFLPGLGSAVLQAEVRPGSAAATWSSRSVLSRRRARW